MVQVSSEVGAGGPFALSASALLGSKVHNRKGEDVGRIEELMIDRRRGCVAYVALSFGGFLGVGEKYFAIPWQALQIDDDGSVVLDVEHEVLENAPGFDKDHWPRTGADAWLREVYIYYGQTPYWEHEA